MGSTTCITRTQRLWSWISLSRFFIRTARLRGQKLLMLSGGRTERFWDVDRSNGAIAYVSGAGIMNGIDARHFDPDGLVTREQMATIAYRFAKAAGYDVRFPSRINIDFPDSGYISDYAYGAVAWVVDVGLMTGTDVGFEPQAHLNRGQIATILLRLADMLKGAQKVQRTEVIRVEANESRRVGRNDDKGIFVDNLGWLLRQTNSGVVECYYRSNETVTICFQGDSVTVDVAGLTYDEIIDAVLYEVLR